MNINEILNKVEDVKSESNYWFVRTAYGRFFDDFLQNKYIAIGWDYLTLHELKYKSEEYIKEKIAKQDKIDASTFGGKVKISTAYNKLMTFISLKEDDVIIIPSRNSEDLAFGRIVGENVYEDSKADDFRKRRDVEWIEVKKMSDLNPIFYKVKSNQHTISNITHYAPYIDRVMGILFTKQDKTHYVLNIEKTDDVNFGDLQALMSNIETLLKNINDKFGFHEDSGEFYVKISLQSKGSLELIKKGKSLALLAFILSLISCGDKSAAIDSDIQKLMNENKEMLTETDKIIKNLEINIGELTEPFNGNGGN